MVNIEWTYCNLSIEFTLNWILITHSPLSIHLLIGQAYVTIVIIRKKVEFGNVYLTLQAVPVYGCEMIRKVNRSDCFLLFYHAPEELIRVPCLNDSCDPNKMNVVLIESENYIFCFMILVG